MKSWVGSNVRLLKGSQGVIWWARGERETFYYTKLGFVDLGTLYTKSEKTKSSEKRAEFGWPSHILQTYATCDMYMLCKVNGWELLLSNLKEQIKDNGRKKNNRMMNEKQAALTADAFWAFWWYVACQFCDPDPPTNPPPLNCLSDLTLHSSVQYVCIVSADLNFRLPAWHTEQPCPTLPSVPPFGNG